MKGFLKETDGELCQRQLDSYYIVHNWKLISV